MAGWKLLNLVNRLNSRMRFIHDHTSEDAFTILLLHPWKFIRSQASSKDDQFVRTLPKIHRLESDRAGFGLCLVGVHAEVFENDFDCFPILARLSQSLLTKPKINMPMNMSETSNGTNSLLLCFLCFIV